MRILDREFDGPVKLEHQSLPNDSGAYIIAHMYKGQIKPVYIGFARDIKKRIQILIRKGPLPKEVLEDEELNLFYSVFEAEKYAEGQDFERELIEFYEPNFNTKRLRPNKEIHNAFKARISEKQAEKARSFSSIAAGFTSLLAIVATIVLSTGIFFKKKDAAVESSLVINKTLADYRKATRDVERSKKNIELLKSEIRALSTKPASANWSIEANRINQRILLIESKLSALEAALTVDPAKSLAIPLLRKDLDNTQNAFKIELTQTKSEVDRVYDQNKWFIGLMITVAIAVLGMAINNYFSKKS